MAPSVSIGFPCWNRGRELRVTLESIRRQNYPGPLELIVVEDGDDGLTEQLAKEYGALYVRRERVEAYPVFQSITSMWNHCMHLAQNEILILQTAEVMHESPNVIADLVDRVKSDPKIMATSLVKDLAQDGSFVNWYNHPREGSRPGWIFGGGPHTFNRKALLEIGGYEELFYGYGHEDDYFFYLLRLNGFRIEYVESAIAAHQWHERTKYEPVTGYANRALSRTLIMEIEDRTRLPLANRQTLEFDHSVSVKDVTETVYDALTMPMSKTFLDWARQCWLFGDKHPDITFVAQRTIANERMGPISEIGEMITEAAWAVIRAKEARTVAMDALNDADRTGAPAFALWSVRAVRCADIMDTWATRSLMRGRRMMKTL